MKNERRGHDGGGFMVAIGFAFLCSLLTGMVCSGYWYDEGVLDHEDGKVVVRTLPDGTRKVYNVEELKEQVTEGRR